MNKEVPIACFENEHKGNIKKKRAKISNNTAYHIVRIMCLLVWAMMLPCSCINEGQPTEEVVVVGNQLPDFEVTMNDGTSTTGAILRTTPSVVMFFHTSCPDCQQILPHIQQLYDEYTDNSVRFTLISREDGETSVSAYWKEYGLTIPYSAQNDRNIYELFAYQRVPRVYISDNTGTIQYIFTDNPTPTYEILSEAIKDVM